MPFATRTFLLSFIPFALLLTGSFFTIQKLVQSTVRNEVRTSLREKQDSIARIRARSELQNSRFLKMVGENATLKAGLQLLLAEPGNPDARATVEDQLREVGDALQFDLLFLSGPEGTPLAGVVRQGERWKAADLQENESPHRGLLTIGQRTFQIASTPVDQGEETLGTLSVGERFDFSEFTTPAVLSHWGKVLRSSVPGVSAAEVEAALGGCRAQEECELRLSGDVYLSLPMQSIYFADGYVLRSLQSVDSANRPVQAVLRNCFLLAGIIAVLAALGLTWLSSRSIVEPISAVIEHLHESETTGLLPEFASDQAAIREIGELTSSFNRAATAIREARNGLHRAYVEFIGTLAHALDARDPYTAGHSWRVSKLSCAIGEVLRLRGEELERLRIGALLHDIGKIGIPDAVLQKPGRLTDAEFALIQQHPIIGRAILQGVQGFQAYLDVVQSHHENWDGSGYPHGTQAEQTPLNARIVHVADAYDAMTSDRPYRRGMSHEKAMSVLTENAGTQFDPVVVNALVQLPIATVAAPGTSDAGGLHRLAVEVGEGSVRRVESEIEERKA